MLNRAIMIAALGMAVAIPGAAQERGTLEFGAFGSATSFDNTHNVNNGFGGGFRVGAFLVPRLAIEFDVGLKQSGRPDGLAGVDVESFAARLTATPLTLGPVSILTGAGLVHTDIQGLNETDGGQVLVGMKLAMGPVASLRLDGLADFNFDGTRNQAVQLGMSLSRSPATVTRTVTREVPGPAADPISQHPDSVSAAETARLRAVEAAHEAMLADRARADAESMVMAETVHFSHDTSDLDGVATAILDRKVTALQGNQSMRLVVTGHASEPGTDEYNMALGFRRAEAVRSFLVSRGVSVGRIDVASAGRGERVRSGPSEEAAAANRRAEFRALIAN